MGEHILLGVQETVHQLGTQVHHQLLQLHHHWVDFGLKSDSSTITYHLINFFLATLETNCPPYFYFGLKNASNLILLIIFLGILI